VITIHCDNCEKPFEIEDDAAGQKASCPYCGDVNRVPAAGGTVVASALPIGKPVTDSPRAAPSTANSPSDPERQITIVRQAMFRAHPLWYMLMVILFLGGIVVAVLAKTTSQFANMPWIVWAGLAAAVAGGLWWLIWWAAPHRWVKLIITNKRTIRQEGIIVRKTSEVLHNHIRNVKIEQSFRQRLLGVGSLSIDSAGGAEHEMIEIQMHNVPKPYKVKDTLDQFRRM
jgi:membrane protein YdbS with pleckstrin-like domain